MDLGGVGVKLNEVVGPCVALEGCPVKLKTGDLAADVVCAPGKILLVDVAGVAGCPLDNWSDLLDDTGLEKLFEGPDVDMAADGLLVGEGVDERFNVGEACEPEGALAEVGAKALANGLRDEGVAAVASVVAEFSSFVTESSSSSDSPVTNSVSLPRFGFTFSDSF